VLFENNPIFSFYILNKAVETLNMPTAIVTGCNSGIGNAFAQVLIDEVLSIRPSEFITGS
jgi:hypothetical protein